MESASSGSGAGPMPHGQRGLDAPVLAGPRVRHYPVASPNTIGRASPSVALTARQIVPAGFLRHGWLSDWLPTRCVDK